MKITILIIISILIFVIGCNNSNLFCHDPGICQACDMDWDELPHCKLNTTTVLEYNHNYSCHDMQEMIDIDYYPRKVKKQTIKTYKDIGCCSWGGTEIQKEYYNEQLYKKDYFEVCLNKS